MSSGWPQTCYVVLVSLELKDTACFPSNGIEDVCNHSMRKHWSLFITLIVGTNKNKKDGKNLCHFLKKNHLTLCALVFCLHLCLCEGVESLGARATLVSCHAGVGN